MAGVQAGLLLRELALLMDEPTARTLLGDFLDPQIFI